MDIVRKLKAFLTKLNEIFIEISVQKLCPPNTKFLRTAALI
jgi:hypothetical protein